MKFDPSASQVIKNLVVPCRHDGTSFHAFIEVDYAKAEFIVIELAPRIRDSFTQVIPFEHIMKEDHSFEALSDSLCQEVVNGIKEYFA